MQTNLRNQLGLTDDMDTYFMRAPHEYWQAIGIKPQPYNDNVGEYDFIHAFFDNYEELSNFSDILVSKLSQNGILWISWPKSSDSADNSQNISESDIYEPFKVHGLCQSPKIDILDAWSALRLQFKNT